MKIIDIIKSGKPTLSFEVFPPKTDSSFESVKYATEEIAKLRPSFMSVTYGAGGGTSKYTLDIAENIKKNYGVPTLAHLTCVSSTKETVKERIEAIKKAGIQNIMALRGDLTPELENSDRSTWDYRNAIDLVREIKAADENFCVAGACYPEIHPESENQALDIKYLKEKVDAGCDFLTTQMFFDNEVFYNFREMCAIKGIDVPLIAGIMPITNVNLIERTVRLAGCSLPKKFTKLVERFGSNSAAMKQAGIVYATEQIVDLLANGVNNIHIYTMNKPDIAGKITQGLGEIINE